MKYKGLLSQVALVVGITLATATVASAVTATTGTPGVPGSPPGTGVQSRDAFVNVWTQLRNWTEGTLGKIIALTMILVGIVSGVVRQSLMGVVVGTGSGIVLYNAAAVLDSIMGYTEQAAQVVNNYAFWL